MKCPKCDLVTSNKRDVCPRCECDLRPRKRELGLPISQPNVPLAQLVSELRKEQGVPQKPGAPAPKAAAASAKAASSAQEPAAAKSGKGEKNTAAAAKDAKSAAKKVASQAQPEEKRSLFSRLFSFGAPAKSKNPSKPSPSKPASQKTSGGETTRGATQSSAKPDVNAPDARLRATAEACDQPAAADSAPAVSSPHPVTPAENAAAPEEMEPFAEDGLAWVTPVPLASPHHAGHGSSVAADEELLPYEDVLDAPAFELSEFREVPVGERSMGGAVETALPAAPPTDGLANELDDLLAELEADQQTAADPDALFPHAIRPTGDFDEIMRELDGENAPSLDDVALLSDPVDAYASSMTETVLEAASATADLQTGLFVEEAFSPGSAAPTDLASERTFTALEDLEPPADDASALDESIDEREHDSGHDLDDDRQAADTDDLDNSETNDLTGAYHLSPTVTPEVMEFGEDDDLLEQQLDALIGDEIVDVEAVKVPVTKQQAPRSFTVDDDIEISFEVEIDGEKDDDGASFSEPGAAPSSQAEAHSAADDPFAFLTGAPLSAGGAPQTAESQRVRSAEELRKAQEVLSKLPSLEDGVADEIAKLLADAYGVHPETLKPKGPVTDDVIRSLQTELDAELRALAQEGTTFLGNELDEPEPAPAAPAPAASETPVDEIALLQAELGAEIEALEREGFSFHAGPELPSAAEQTAPHVSSDPQRADEPANRTDEFELVSEVTGAEGEALPAVDEAPSGNGDDQSLESDLRALTNELDEEYRMLVEESGGTFGQSPHPGGDELNDELSFAGEDEIFAEDIAEPQPVIAFDAAARDQEPETSPQTTLDDVGDLSDLTAELDAEYALLLGKEADATTTPAAPERVGTDPDEASGEDALTPSFDLGTDCLYDQGIEAGASTEESDPVDLAVDLEALAVAEAAFGITEEHSVSEAVVDGDTAAEDDFAHVAEDHERDDVGAEMEALALTEATWGPDEIVAIDAEPAFAAERRTEPVDLPIGDEHNLSDLRPDAELVAPDDHIVFLPEPEAPAERPSDDTPEPAVEPEPEPENDLSSLTDYGKFRPPVRDLIGDASRRLLASLDAPRAPHDRSITTVSSDEEPTQATAGLEPEPSRPLFTLETTNPLQGAGEEPAHTGIFPLEDLRRGDVREAALPSEVGKPGRGPSEVIWSDASGEHGGRPVDPEMTGAFLMRDLASIESTESALDGSELSPGIEQSAASEEATASEGDEEHPAAPAEALPTEMTGAFLMRDLAAFESGSGCEPQPNDSREPDDATAGEQPLTTEMTGAFLMRDLAAFESGSGREEDVPVEAAGSHDSGCEPQPSDSREPDDATAGDQPLTTEMTGAFLMRDLAQIDETTIDATASDEESAHDEAQSDGIFVFAPEALAGREAAADSLREAEDAAPGGASAEEATRGAEADELDARETIERVEVPSPADLDVIEEAHDDAGPRALVDLSSGPADQQDPPTDFDLELDSEELDLDRIADAFSEPPPDASLSVKASRVETGFKSHVSGGNGSNGGQEMLDAVSTGVFLANDLRRIVAEKPSPFRSARNPASAPPRPNDVPAELWRAADAELAGATADELEVSAIEIGALENGDQIDLLFQVADDEVRDPERARRHREEIPASHKKKVESKKLEAALDTFEKEQRVVSKKLQQVRARHAAEQEARRAAALQPASMFRRAFAMSVDFVSLTALTFVLAFGSSMPVEIKEAAVTGSMPDRLQLIAYVPELLLTELVLWVLLSTIWLAGWGRTFGGRVAGIEVVSSVAEPVNLVQAFIRSCAQVTTLLTCGLGLLPLLGKKKRALHDRLSRTYVRKHESDELFEE